MSAQFSALTSVQTHMADTLTISAATAPGLRRVKSWASRFSSSTGPKSRSGQSATSEAVDVGGKGHPRRSPEQERGREPKICPAEMPRHDDRAI